MKNNSELMFEELEMQNEMMSDSDIMIILGAAAVAVKIIVVFYLISRLFRNILLKIPNERWCNEK